MKRDISLEPCGKEDIQRELLGAVRDECHILENHTGAG